MTRDKVKEQDKWDLTTLFKERKDFEDKLKKIFIDSEKDFEQFKPREFSKNTKAIELKNFLASYFEYLRNLEMIYTYAHLKHDEDISCPINKSSYEKARTLYHKFSSETAWLEPSILGIDQKYFEELMKDCELDSFSFYMQKLKDQKKYILSADQEKILSMAASIQTTASGAFSALSNADLDFGSIEDGDGKSHHLTQGSYGKFIKSKDRILRKNAFNKLHKSFMTFENTIAELIQGQVKNHLFNAKVRGYKNCLEAALKPHNIDLSVYHNLINEVEEGIEPLHRYISLRKKILQVDNLYSYDLRSPLINITDKKYSFNEACNIVIDSVAILGEKYQETLRKGLMEDRWVDVFENKGKRSGAYSSGCYNSVPYILMNFQGTLNDVLTLSHEAGHSMNTYLSNQKQQYHNASYTIFVAEVASTFNEQLTYEYLYNKAESKEERIYLINQQIDAICSTFFRQAAFAAFELKIHELSEEHTPLTATVMKEIYGNLNKKYFGKDYTLTEEASSEYLRIPHFYYNFYVYQYSTGIAAALTLVDKVKNKGLSAYMEFLSAGGSDYSIEILKKAGADMTCSYPIKKTLKTFSDLLQKLEKEFEINEGKR